MVGTTLARLLTFGWRAFRHRPSILVGFHLLLNGLTAVVLARLIGVRCIYFSGGGPTEVLDGGARGENRLFGRMDRADPAIERDLIRLVDLADAVITMGSGAARFFRERGVNTTVEVMPGAPTLEVWPDRPGPSARWDCAFVGRLAAVKRVDVLLEALALARAQLPEMTAVLVGDGPLRRELHAHARRLGLATTVTFAGHQVDVASWLRQAKVFVLTSDSESVSLALMEAMALGLPAVVSDVGDLRDLIQDGVNGYLVPRRSAVQLADRLVALLREPETLGRFSAAALRIAARYKVDAAARRWDAVLERLQ